MKRRRLISILRDVSPVCDFIGCEHYGNRPLFFPVIKIGRSDWIPLQMIIEFVFMNTPITPFYQRYQNIAGCRGLSIRRTR